MNGNIVLLGAGGTGMCGIAGILGQLGFADKLVCIDSTQSELTDKLVSQGLQVIIGHKKYEVQVEDHVIYSEAAVNSSEVQQAKTLVRQNKQQRLVMNYFEFLGEISKYFRSVGVAGTNGKSSTTAMLIYATKDLPSFGLGILGALVPQLLGNGFAINTSHTEDIQNIFSYIFTGKGLDYNILKKYYFVVEACEYRRHFLHLDLDYTLLTNIELDHTDYYKDLEDYQNAFNSLIHNTKKNIFCTQNIHLEGITIVQKKYIDFEHIFGSYNQDNGNLVLAMVDEIDTSLNESGLITQRLELFKGLRRRMEVLFSNEHGATIFSDYGHVASSIQLGYEALKIKYPDKKITCIFQPHQISRIVKGWNEFPLAFEKYDKVIIYDIYAARESLDLLKNIGIENLKSKEGLGNVFAKHVGGKYTEDFEEIKKIINSALQDEIVIIYSAGDVDFDIRKVYNH